MIEVYDLNLKRTAVLQNAFGGEEEEALNDVPSYSFRIPSGDEKCRYLQKRHFVRANSGAMYRIMELEEANDDAMGVTAVTCEGVLGTLADTLLFGDVTRDNVSTRENLEWALSHRNDWQLGECDFEELYSYGFSNEHLLPIVQAIPQPITQYYRFETDTSRYPWRLSLKKIDPQGSPDFRVMKGLNWLSSRKTQSSEKAVTRLYCLGSGEGVNQTNIRDVNGGQPYLLAEPEAIERYGLIDGLYVNRKMEDAGELLAMGKQLLKESSQERVEYEVDAAETGLMLARNARVGQTILFAPDNYLTYITKVKRYDDEPGRVELTIANHPGDLAKELADIAQRQRIESTYSQGATQIWGSPMSGNADAENPLVYPLYIPKNIKIMNEVQLKVKVERFRGDFKMAASGGGSTRTSGASGGGSYTSEEGGQETATTETKITQVRWDGDTGYSNKEDTGAAEGSTGYSQPGCTTAGSHKHSVSSGSTSESGAHYHVITNHRHSLGGHSHKMSHTHPLNFTLSFTIPALTIPLPGHRHRVSLGGHTHSVTIPNHTHDLTYGIVRGKETPKAAVLLINGEERLSIGTDFEGDITAYLAGEDGKIPRGRYINIGIRPDMAAYISITPTAIGFIQSKTGGQY